MAKKSTSVNWLVTVLFIGFLVWLNQREGDTNGPLPSSGNPLEDVSLLEVHGDYEVLDGCTLSKNRRNDGDSFFVNHANGKTEFRLYYVDTPESRFREYANGETNGKRIAGQGHYFGGLDREATTQLGMEGKRFVTDLLGSQSFRVITRWEHVFSPERRYAFVVVEHEGKKVYLHELLVEKGYARIHTKPATMPDGDSVNVQLKKLKRIEQSAKKAGLGGWQ